mmetsp:Transcript_54456/g.117886  ORF Transcript_54456/g.117886 Transcript_54456/m.117886 type:complete len:397 (+) Transcript_54456:49-1239(+)|eukprot:CAMPEP_0170621020 /NCGR_PEP_ID=MMETSP0224-20130122/28377_1 /TAXON_ID=285029 /ORGANISM="Togula jolla, Strain CCCM 725" /LENGTH=396 /DNA_ID=CAMNT_0010947249 /DNA_START=46 /DNA_END=1236 /DNA_ORIENTATION=-
MPDDKADSGGMSSSFLTTTGEKQDMNQYWYSQPTADVFINEVVDNGGCAALVSTPSIYFGLPPDVRARCHLLDFDRQWENDPGFVFYDYNEPEGIPHGIRGTFDFLLIDPPFITSEAWALYAKAAKLLMKSQGAKVLCTTIAENDGLMQNLLNLHPVAFRPSIPNLVYQYSAFANYTSTQLSSLNPEVDHEEWRPTSRSECLLVTNSLEAAPLRTRAATTPVSISSTGTRMYLADCGVSIAEESDGPLGPEVQLLMQLRKHLDAIFKCVAVASLPASRLSTRQQVEKIRPKLEAARKQTETAAADFGAWLSTNHNEIAEALGETPEAFSASLLGDRWRVRSVVELMEAACDGNTTQSEVATSSKQHTVALFRLSGQVLDRIKELKRQKARSVSLCI